MRRVLVWILVLAAVQGGLWVLWRGRSPEGEVFDVEPASGAAPAIAPRTGLVHVWATWCAPCREELPGLIAAAEAAGVPLVAVSVDQNPASVVTFFEGVVPKVVVRDPRMASALGVSELPATLRVRDGNVVERVQGAREWSSGAARRWLAGSR